MKRTVLTIAVAFGLAAPAFAESPAETAGQANGPFVSSPAASVTAADVLSGDSVDERLPVNAGGDVTRQSEVFTAGHLQLARNMGVNPSEYTSAELSKMYIGKYD